MIKGLGCRFHTAPVVQTFISVVIYAQCILQTEMSGVLKNPLKIRVFWGGGGDSHIYFVLEIAL